MYLSFLPLFLSSPIYTAKTGGRIFTVYTLNDADSPKDVVFESFDENCPGYQNPLKTSKKWARLGNFRPKEREIEIAIFSER